MARVIRRRGGVILKPEWGTYAVYKVLYNKKIINNKGYFSRKELKDIWHRDKYLSMHSELLELMKKFQLCYEIPNSKGNFIAPQLLSDNQPEYDWEEKNNLILRYTYADFMPKGIISRFIVIMHHYIEQDQYVWKSGVILSKDNTRAEIIEEYAKRVIKIRIIGVDKSDLMTIINYELEKINKSYKRLEYKQLIPCNCDKCESSKDKEFYDFKELKDFEQAGEPYIQCRKSRIMVHVKSLIDDIVYWKKDDIEEESIISHDINQSRESMVSVTIHNHQEQVGNSIMSSFTNDHSRKQNFTNSTIRNSGANAFSTGDTSGTVVNSINQLPNFDAEPDKQELKELLSKLYSAVLESNLDEEETEETFEQIQEIAEALKNSKDGIMKKTAKRAMKMLRGTAAALPPSAAMVTICNQLPDLINKIFT
ncbi:MAG: COR domain-containing protein [Cyanobacteria bacterium P01_A01_bin.84]